MVYSKSTYDALRSLEVPHATALSLAKFVSITGQAGVTPGMGTVKTLGTPSNAFEYEFDSLNVPAIVQDDGTVVFKTANPMPTSTTGSTASVNASSVQDYRGAWVNVANVLGAGDTNRAVFTGTSANEPIWIDMGFSIPAIPAGGLVRNVAVTPGAFASSDTVMPYTVELVDKYGQHVGSAAQAANAGGTFTFTGVTNTDITNGIAVRLKGTHNNSTTSVTLNVDNCAVVVNYSTSYTYHYRSELIYTSDLIDGSNDYTNFRWVEGDRLRVAFDVMGVNIKAQTNSNACVFQVLGRAIDNSFPFAPVSVQVINGVWRLQHGAGVDIGVQATYRDQTWYRWELDIPLSRTGTVSTWLNGDRQADWKPTAGTYYAGNSNNALDLQWAYIKSGMYGAADTSPQGLPKVLVRNRRLTVVKANGTTTSWLGSGIGSAVSFTNPSTGLPY